MPQPQPGRRREYRSDYRLFGLPLFHLVVGRDPQTGALGRAVGIIAVGRFAFGVIALGQVAVGVLPIGQISLGLLLALGQVSVSGYEAFGQVAVAPRLAVGQVGVGGHALAQVGVGRYVIAQAGRGAHVHSAEQPCAAALASFHSEFPTLFGLLRRVVGDSLRPDRPAEAPAARARPTGAP